MRTPCLMVHGQNDPAIRTLDYERMMAMPDLVHQVIFGTIRSLPDVGRKPALQPPDDGFPGAGFGRKPASVAVEGRVETPGALGIWISLATEPIHSTLPPMNDRSYDDAPPSLAVQRQMNCGTVHAA